MIKIYKTILKFFRKKDNNLRCPNCNGNEWFEGPGGGSFGNIQCIQCKQKYNNLGIFGLNEIK